jgi:hypothetical protein
MHPQPKVPAKNKTAMRVRTEDPDSLLTFMKAILVEPGFAARKELQRRKAENSGDPWKDGVIMRRLIS